MPRINRARIFSPSRTPSFLPSLLHPFPPFSLLPLSFPISLIVKADVFDYIHSRALVRLAADRSKFSHARNPRGSELRRWPHIIIGGCEKISTRRNTPGFLSLSRSLPGFLFFPLPLSLRLSLFFLYFPTEAPTAKLCTLCILIMLKERATGHAIKEVGWSLVGRTAVFPAEKFQ